jgi:hypothetical protein
MAQRPQAFVGEPLVVPALLVGAEPYASQPVGRVGGWHVQAVASIDHGSIGGSGAVCHPYSSACTNQRFQRRNEPAGRSLDRNAAVGTMVVLDRLTVGEHDNRCVSVKCPDTLLDRLQGTALITLSSPNGPVAFR